ncbi:MAG TPA: HD-GYP domain-containing protein [Vicinamibacterales bacterium]|nr:HD-GYP domain-containing protein [Vicinamibacterales bacterium]
MQDSNLRHQLSDDLLRRFGAVLRGVQLYSPTHPIVTRNLDALADALRALHAHDTTVVIGLLGDELIVGDLPMSKASSSMGELIRRLRSLGIERITFAPEVTAEELRAFVDKFGEVEKTLGRSTQEDLAGQLESASIKVGRVTITERAPEDDTDAATIRKLYAEAVSVASVVWESARTDEHPDPTSAQSMIDGLAQAVLQNRAALMALTALKEYDNYTFTHMVNVSILTMAQARGLGIEGPMLREFGMAALMHDIGKVKTPTEILNKPDKLTAEEFAIMKRHTIDGAEILRGTAEIPPLSPVVAFEHHLRIDGSGYPDGVSRPTLNLATMLCGIADVYDAMRSQRKYQQAFPSERILTVLQRNDGSQFDQHLVRRFVQLIGIYPVGNLVRLNTDEVAVVLRVHAPDPFRPKVRVLFAPDGSRLEIPRDINLWEAADGATTAASTVTAPLDPADYKIDPLVFL